MYLGAASAVALRSALHTRFAAVCSRAHSGNLTCLGLYLGGTIWCRSKHGASDGDLQRGVRRWELLQGLQRRPGAAGSDV